MDAHHREFRDSIAYDERLKKVAKALGLKFGRYEEAEQFFLDVADASGLNGWELDRLLYNGTDDVLDQIKNGARNEAPRLEHPPRRRRSPRPHC